jgi:uncharacterized protein YciI
MKMFILLSTYLRPLDEVDAALSDHIAWVTRGYEEGHILVSGRREPPEGGAVVMRAADEEEVRALLADDPFQARGLARYEVHAFGATDFPRRSAGFQAFAAASLT